MQILIKTVTKEAHGTRIATDTTYSYIHIVRDLTKDELEKLAEFEMFINRLPSNGRMHISAYDNAETGRMSSGPSSIGETIPKE